MGIRDLSQDGIAVQFPSDCPIYHNISNVPGKRASIRYPSMPSGLTVPFGKSRPGYLSEVT